MIDQSNRAGKLNINGSENLDGQNVLSAHPSSTTVAKRHNQSKRTRGLPQNEKRLHHPTNSTKTPMTSAAAAAATVVSRQSSLSYTTKGKSI